MLTWIKGPVSVLFVSDKNILESFFVGFVLRSQSESVTWNLPRVWSGSTMCPFKDRFKIEGIIHYILLLCIFLFMRPMLHSPTWFNAVPPDLMVAAYIVQSVPVCCLMLKEEETLAAWIKPQAEQLLKLHPPSSTKQINRSRRVTGQLQPVRNRHRDNY